MKHSGATRVVPDLRSDGDEMIVLTISDNGSGFSSNEVRFKSGSYGLDNIRQRVDDMDGELTIRSARGVGTSFEIEVPRLG